MRTSTDVLPEPPSVETLDLSSLLESIPASAILVDDRRRVVGANWRFRSRARSSARCVGNRCSALLHEEPESCDDEPWSCPLESCRGTARPCRQVHLHSGRTGRRFEAVESTPLGVPGGGPRLTLQTFRAIEHPTAEPPGRLVGHSTAMLDLRWQIERSRQRIAPILVLGEAGTERELVARELHESGPRREGPFAVFPNKLPAEAAGGEAPWPPPGLIEAAEEGTIFLDEVTTLTGPAQRALLATLSSPGALERRPGWLGLEGSRWVFGTSKRLAQAARQRELLADLVPWIGGATIEVPPLRERTGDLPLLVLALRPWLVAPRELEIEPSVAAALAPLPLYGNLWELRRRLQDGVLNAGRGPLRAEHLVWSS